MFKFIRKKFKKNKDTKKETKELIHLKEYEPNNANIIDFLNTTKSDNPNYMILDMKYTNLFTFENYFNKNEYSINIISLDNQPYNPLSYIKSEKDIEEFCEVFTFHILNKKDTTFFKTTKYDALTFYFIKSLFTYVLNKNPETFKDFFKEILNCYEDNKNLKKEVLNYMKETPTDYKTYYLKKIYIESENIAEELHLYFENFYYFANETKKDDSIKISEKQAIIFEDSFDNKYIHYLYSIATKQLTKQQKWVLLNLDNNDFISDTKDVFDKCYTTDYLKGSNYFKDYSFTLSRKNTKLMISKKLYEKNDFILPTLEKVFINEPKFMLNFKENLIKEDVKDNAIPENIEPLLINALYKKIDNSTFKIILFEKKDELICKELYIINNELYIKLKENKYCQLMGHFDIFNLCYDKIINEKDVYNNKEFFLGDILKQFDPKHHLIILYLFISYPMIEKMYKIDFFKKFVLKSLEETLDEMNTSTPFFKVYGENYRDNVLICTKIQEKFKNCMNHNLFNYIHWNMNINLETNEQLHNELNLTKYQLKEIINLNTHRKRSQLELLGFSNLSNQLFDENIKLFNKDIDTNTIKIYDNLVNILANYYSESESIKIVNKILKRTNEYLEINSLRILEDTFTMYHSINLDFTPLKNIRTMPELITLHDEAIVAYNNVHPNVYRRKVSNYKNTPITKDYSKFLFEDDNFIIVTPKETNEIRTEGIVLHHCVGSYVDRVLNNVTNIIFIRKKDNIAKPFYTVQINDNGEIIQIHGFGNCNVSANPKLEKFVKKWIKECKLKANNYNVVR